MALTGVLASLVLALNRRLRLHSAAVLGSALGWFFVFLVILPRFTRPGPNVKLEDYSVLDFGMACCPFFLGTYHLLLCAALVVGLLREARRNRTEHDDGPGERGA